MCAIYKTSNCKRCSFEEHFVDKIMSFIRTLTSKYQITFCKFKQTYKKRKARIKDNWLKSISTMCKLLVSISNVRYCIRNTSFSIRNKIVPRKQIKMRFPKDAALKLRDQAPSKPKIYHVSYLNKIQSWLNWRFKIVLQNFLSQGILLRWCGTPILQKFALLLDF